MPSPAPPRAEVGRRPSLPAWGAAPEKDVSTRKPNISSTHCQWGK